MHGGEFKGQALVRMQGGEFKGQALVRMQGGEFKGQALVRMQGGESLGMQLVRDRKTKLATTSMAVLKMSIQYCCEMSRWEST